jgi:amino acid adenylation domain-containing protein
MFKEFVLAPILESLMNFSESNSFFINNSYYTYKDLSENISKIRYGIQGKTFSGKNIGLVANDDIETYSSIIAIWMEGLSYVPVHPKHPLERSLKIIEQAGIELIIDSSEEPVFQSAQIIQSKRLQFEGSNLDLKHTDDSETAYILFTSGSTGVPKGVPITRGNLGTFMKAFWEVGFQLDENDRCLQCFDLTFDVSVQSFIVPLSKGACTYTIPHDQIKPSYAYGLMDEQRLTFGAMAPSMIRFLRPYFAEIELHYLKYIILTAEASPTDLVGEWAECIPNAEIFDFYGPTEATIYCTYYRFVKNKANKQLNGMLSIGKPLNGVIATVMDDAKNILQENQKGELCISGDQITPGYWNNSEKNASSFFTKDINGTAHRFYKTGDLCYIDEDGDIMYSGRLDFQVKIQGFRIELGEIEHHAREYVKGHNVVAVAYENVHGINEIALFAEDRQADTGKLLEYLKSKMPNYMIPSKIFLREEFPLNSNGKVDRNLLKKSITEWS